MIFCKGHVTDIGWGPGGFWSHGFIRPVVVFGVLGWAAHTDYDADTDADDWLGCAMPFCDIIREPC